MKIIDIKALEIPEVKVIRFARFSDHRGYFTEHYRCSDFQKIPFMEDICFLQCNESYSRTGTVRGLHFQWNPFMGKLLRTLTGRMIDMVLDIRLNSPTFGKIIAYDMPANTENNYDEWIWVPPGFAHGNFFPQESIIEYFCSGEYSPGCEAGISPIAADIDWTLCDPDLKALFDKIVPDTTFITEKDKNGHSLKTWTENPDSGNFIYGKM